MTQGLVKIAIIHYTGALKSSIYGLEEMFILANRMVSTDINRSLFSVTCLDIDNVTHGIVESIPFSDKIHYEAIIIPPSIDLAYALAAAPLTTDWIRYQHRQGAIVCSACAGVFILAMTGLLTNRIVTTHWGLTEEFLKCHADITLDIEKILLNDGDIITAGGLMSWIDLGLELVAQFTNIEILRQLGKHLIMDTGLREQRYYHSFLPKWDHGDSLVLKAQHYLQAHFNTPITISCLANVCFLTQRTFLRRFFIATGLKPRQYLQKLRIQKASELIETTKYSFNTIAQKVGYEDISAFRKMFIKIIGLTPKEFRRRLSRWPCSK